MKKLYAYVSREDGSYLTEAILPTLLMLSLIFITVMIWFSFTQAILAQDALTQTSLNVSSTGIWTKRQALQCEKFLPGDKYINDVSGNKVLDPERGCHVYVLKNPTKNPATATDADWKEITPICASGYLGNNKESVDNPYPTVPVGDCYNKVDSSNQFIRYAGYTGNFKDAVPVKVEVTYRQWWLPYCFLDETGCSDANNNASDNVVRRSMIVQSQTRRET